MRISTMILFFACISTGCGAPMLSSDADSAADDPACTVAGLEPDLRPTAFAGSAVGADGALVPGQYVFSTTALRMKRTAASAARFRQAMELITPALQTQSGLLAQATATSERCNVARTLTVWRDEASMYAFVRGAAHRAAVQSVGEISRGGSRVTHWNGSAAEATWANAAQVLEASTGPSY
jgi:heme-degrading monooxygenase HmoA